MDIRDRIKSIKESYQKVVRPLLNRAQYIFAGFEFANINVGEIQPNRAEIIKYHSGMNLIEAANTLEEKLKSGNPGGEAQKMFEAYLAQLILSIKTDNTYEKSK